MTIYEVISKYPVVCDLKTEIIQRVCIDRGITDAEATYVSSMKRLADLAIADCLVAAVNLPDFTENDLTQNYNRESVLKTANDLYGKYGLITPTITSRNVW